MKYCSDTCIHTRACSRIQALLSPKGNTESLIECGEACPYYLNSDMGSLVNADDAVRYARSGADSIRSGYDEFDVWAVQDLDCLTIGDIVSDLETR